MAAVATLVLLAAAVWGAPADGNGQQPAPLAKHREHDHAPPLGSRPAAAGLGAFLNAVHAASARRPRAAG